MSSGECILTKLCGVQCHASDGPFVYNDLSENMRNYVIDSSVSKCGSETFVSTLRLGVGCIYVNRVNLTDNTCDEQPAIYCTITSSTADVACSMQYCNVHKNIANSYRVIQFYCPSLNTNIMLSNIIDNEQKGTSHDTREREKKEKKGSKAPHVPGKSPSPVLMWPATA